MPKESSQDLGLFDRFWTHLAPRCFLIPTFLPVRHYEGDMSAPKPYKTNPTPTPSSRPPLSLQFSVRFRSLIYSEEKSFYLSYGKHWSRRLRSVRTPPAKSSIHTYIHSIYRNIANYMIFKEILIKKKSGCTKCGSGFSF